MALTPPDWMATADTFVIAAAVWMLAQELARAAREQPRSFEFVCVAIAFGIALASGSWRLLAWLHDSP